MRKGGLEPPPLAGPDPKSGASADSATFARDHYKTGREGYGDFARLSTNTWAQHRAKEVVAIANSGYYLRKD